jgi:hypothetical protein
MDGFVGAGLIEIKEDEFEGEENDETADVLGLEVVIVAKSIIKNLNLISHIQKYNNYIESSFE